MNTQDNSSKIYVLEKKGKLQFLNVPKDKEDTLLEKYPDVRLATGSELDDFDKNSKTKWGKDSSDYQDFAQKAENLNADRESRKSSIVTREEKKQANTDALKASLIGEKESPYDRSRKSYEDRRPMDNIIESSINQYNNYKNWIESVQNAPDNPYSDEYVPANVKNELQEWFNNTIETTQEKDWEDNLNRLSTEALEYLEREKKEKQVPRKVSTSGGGIPFPSTETVTERYNTPEQLQLVKDWEEKTDLGRYIKKSEIETIKKYDELISQYEDDIQKKKDELSSSRMAKARPYEDIGGFSNYLRMNSVEKKEYNKRQHEKNKVIDNDNLIKDINNAENQLEELKKIQARARDFNDKSALTSFFKQLGRTLPTDLTNTLSVGLIGLGESFSLNNAIKNNPEGLSIAGLELVQQYANARSMDYGISQEIADGVSQTIPFIAEFAVTGGMVSGAKAILKKSLSKTFTRLGAKYKALDVATKSAKKLNSLVGKSYLGNMGKNFGKDIIDAGSKAFLMPSTYSGALDMMSENENIGFLDAFSKKYLSNVIASYAEGLGDRMTIFEMQHRNPMIADIMSVTGIQSFPAEYLEENIETAIHAIMKTGEGEWSDLLDERNQIVTASTVALIQAPYATINTAGYLAGLSGDARQKRSINKGYRNTIAQMHKVFGEDTDLYKSQIDDLIQREDLEKVEQLNMLSNDIQASELEAEQKDALLKYTMSALAKQAMQNAKADVANQAMQNLYNEYRKYVNENTGKITAVKILDSDNELYVTSGEIVLTEDGKIDEEKSSQTIYLRNPQTGISEVVPISYVSELIEEMKLEDAVEQGGKEILEEYHNNNQNEESKLYTQGSYVSYTDDKGLFSYGGQIVDIDDKGNYVIEEFYSKNRVIVEPRFINNTENIDDIRAGSQVMFIHPESGEKMVGISDYDITPESYVDRFIFINGQPIPFQSVLGIYNKQDQREVNLQSVDEYTPVDNDVDVEELRDVSTSTPTISAEIVNLNNASEAIYDIVATYPNGVKITLIENADLSGIDLNKFLDENESTFQEYAEKSKKEILGTQVEIQSQIKKEIPRDNQGNPIYTQSTPKQAVENMKTELQDDNAVTSFIEANIKEQEKRLKAVKEPKPSTNLAQYKNELYQSNAEKESIQTELDFWNDALVEHYESSPQGVSIESRETLKQIAKKSLFNKLNELTNNNSIDLTKASNNRLVSLLNLINDIERNQQQDNTFITPQEQDILDDLKNGIEEQGYTTSNIVGKELNDNDNDNVTVRDVFNATPKGTELIDTSLFLTKEVKPTIIRNGEVIQKGVYDAERRLSQNAIARNQHRQAEKERIEKIKEEAKRIEEEAKKRAKKPYQPRIELLSTTTEQELENLIDSTNDVIIAFRAYFTAQQYTEEEKLYEWQKQLLGMKIDKESLFYLYGDKQKILERMDYNTIAISWFASKEQSRYLSNSLDQIQDEIGAPSIEEMIEFIFDHPTNRVRVRSDLTTKAELKFRKLASDIAGTQIWGPESSSGRQFVATYQNIYEKAQEQALFSETIPYEMEVPQALLNIMESIGIQDFNSIQEIKDKVEEMYEDGEFSDTSFPYGPEDFELIIKYLNYVENKAERETTVSAWEGTISENSSFISEFYSTAEDAELKESIEEEINRKLAREENQIGLPEQYITEPITEQSNETEEIAIPLSESQQWEQDNFTEEEIKQRREYGLTPEQEYETTYRGISVAEWEAIQRGETLQSENLAEGNSFVTPNKEFAESAGGTGKSELVVVFKPESRVKMIEGDKKGDGLVEYYGKELSLDDVLYVYDSNGNVVYDSRKVEKENNKKANEELNKKIEQAEKEVDTNPTEAQKEVGNYKKGHVNIQGLDITIENPKNSYREGVDKDGKEWSIKMTFPYGYIKGTEGVDGDQIDVFIGRNPNSKKVFVYDQVNEDGTFDEHKIIIGVDSGIAANAVYHSAYNSPLPAYSKRTEVSMDDFKKWLGTSNKKTKPFAEYIANQQNGRVEEGRKPTKKVEQTETTPKQQSTEKPKYKKRQLPKNFGENNKVFTKEIFEQAMKKMRESRGSMSFGVNLGLLPEAISLVGYYVEGGIRTLLDISEILIDELGEGVIPLVKPAYSAITKMEQSEKYLNELDTNEYIDSVKQQDLLNDYYERKQNSIEDVILEEETTDIAQDSNQQLDLFGNLINQENEKEPITKPRRTDTNAELSDNITQRTEIPVQRGQEYAKRDDNTQSRGQAGVGANDARETAGPGTSGGTSTRDANTGLHTNRGTNRGHNRSGITADARGTAKDEVVKKNTNNNRQDRNENVVPGGNVGKIKANIRAIKLSKQLIERGEQATEQQKNILRQYTGWGGLSQIFKPTDSRYQELKDILSGDEYESARASTTTAFYTPIEITNSIWDIITKLGFKGGDILEPSAGIGNIFALMPEEISNSSNLKGVELDRISGNILSLLYPDADINVGGFEEQSIKNNSFDLVVTNVPFGNFKVYDKIDSDISKMFNIHDYFIAKSVRKLKPRGIGVFVTTSSTLDKSTKLREWLDTEGNVDVIDAVRLNTNTFKTDAGTEATSDIIIVRKRDEKGVSPYAKNIKNTVTTRKIDYLGYNSKKEEITLSGYMTYNEYYSDNPNRLAGEMKFGLEGGNALRPTEQRLAPVNTIDQQTVIQEMIDSLPTDLDKPKQTAKSGVNIISDNPILDNTKEGGLMLIDGLPYIKSFGQAYSLFNDSEDKDVKRWNENRVTSKKYTKQQVLKDYLSLKDALDKLIDSEVNDVEESIISDNRKELNRQYDYFIRKYGYLNNNTKISFLKYDVDYVSVQAIENVKNIDDKNNKHTKSDIFSKRVIIKQKEPKAENIEDAINISISLNGFMSVPFIAESLGKTEQEIEKELKEKNLAFVNPTTGLLEDNMSYLSGNVREKLKQAEDNNENGEFDKNIKELTKVVPPQIPLSSIRTTLGTSWISTDIYDKYFEEVLGTKTNFVRTSQDKFITKRTIIDKEKSNLMGIPNVVDASILALNQMNGTDTNIYDKAYIEGKKKSVFNVEATRQAALKQSEIADNFESWLKKQNQYKEQLENEYNDRFNSTIIRDVDVSSFDRFPNTSGLIVSVKSQKNTDGTFTYYFRSAKENTESDNKRITEVAKELGVEYNPDTQLYSTNDVKKSSDFTYQLNGDAKILRKHQKEGVMRGLLGSTLLAHEVGTGKTLTLITTAMEMRRLGLANKPCIVVQRSTYQQFVKEIKNQYPNAKVLAPTDKDLKASERQSLFAKIAYNDWDIVVLYHDYLDRIPDDPRRESKLIAEKIQESMDIIEMLEEERQEGSNAGKLIGSIKKQIDKLSDEYDTKQDEIKENEKNIKNIEKKKANVDARTRQLLDRGIDKTLYFEQLGIDAMLIDEAHGYKRLGFYTSYSRIKGIDTSESKKAQSTRMKTSYILENNGGKNVVMATGTPISNTMAEMWTFLRYLLPQSELERFQINNFDSFVKNFGSIEDSAEFNTSGQFVMTKRFSSYSNLPELLAIWKQIAHTVLTEEIDMLRSGIGTPVLKNGKPNDYIIPQTPTLKSVMSGIKRKLEEFSLLPPIDKKEQRHIPLVMFNLAKRAAIDVRLIDPSLPDHEGSKINHSIDIVLNSLEETKDYNGTVAIFCDDKQSKDKTFNVFNDIKEKLVKRGIPREQIASIDDYTNDNKKAKLLEDINNGIVRVVMGGTERLGTGVNIQKRLHTLIHLDVPVKPSEYQQRNGRIQRQGNIHLKMNKPIVIERIGVEKTLDVTGYQRLAIKENFIRQIMKGDMNERSIQEQDDDNVGEGSFNVMMANLSGSQSALLLTQTQNKLRRLESRRNEHEQSQIFFNEKVLEAKKGIETANVVIKKIEDYKKQIESLFPEKKITSISIAGETAKSDKAIQALIKDKVTKVIEDRHAAMTKDTYKSFDNISIKAEINGIPFLINTLLERSYMKNDLTSSNKRIYRYISLLSEETTDFNPITNTLQSDRRTNKLIDILVGAESANIPQALDKFLQLDQINSLINKREVYKEKAKAEIESYEPQIGKEFEGEEEYNKTKEREEELLNETQLDVERIEEEQKKETEDIEVYDINEYLAKAEEEKNKDKNADYNYSDDKYKKVKEKQFNKVIDKLKQTGLAKDIVTNKKTYNEKIKSKDNTSIQTPTGEVYGFVDQEGVVYLDKDKMNLNTPIHEFAHLWLDHIEKYNTELYYKGKELILSSEYWDKVNSMNQYKNLPFEKRVKEALAMSIGDKGEKIKSSIYQMVKNWLKDLWGDIKAFFNIQSNGSIEDITLNKFLDLATSELLSGEEIAQPTQREDISFNSVDEYVDETLGVNTPDIHRDAIDRKMNTVIWKMNLSKFREGHQDRYLYVKKFLKYLRDQGIEVAEHNDYYKKSTHVFGKVDALIDQYNTVFHQPILNSIQALTNKTYKYRDIENYVMLKHGLERNEYMSNKDREKERQPREDYSGLLAIEEEVMTSAESYIRAFEYGREKEIAELWENIKKATDNSIDLLYQGGLIDKETLTDLKERYEFYVPLRGHDEVTAEDRWDVYDSIGARFETPLKKAKGRVSRAYAPFAYIFNINQSAINQSQRNDLNQTILRLAMQDKTGLMNVSETWFEIVGENEDGMTIYEARFPEYSEDVLTRRENEQLFEDKMNALQSQKKAFKGSRKGLDLGEIFIKPHQAKEHQVQIWQNGVQKTVYINADPAIAKAINGTNIQSNDKIMSSISKVSRFMASVFTTRNPKFVFTNACRDFIFASSILSIKESPKYLATFWSNIPASMKAIAKHNFGKADGEKNYVDQMVYEYILNGGETGYSHYLEIDQMQKRIEKEIKKGKKDTSTTRLLLDILSKANNIAENYSRFATYMTSRQEGRSITQSISDAKEVTLNFNRRGSGSFGAKYMNALYLFYNVGFQALDNFARAVKNNPAKGVAVITANIAMSAFLIPALNLILSGGMGGDDDDDIYDSYSKLGEWERQNNLCIYTPKGFIKFPLPHEIRVWYAMGDNLRMFMNLEKDATTALLDQVLSFSDLVPTNPLGAVDASWAELMPDMTKPFAQLQANKKFTGSPIYKAFINENAPAYQQVRTNKFNKPYAPEFLINSLAMLDNVTGGDGVKKGNISLNPDKVDHFLSGYFGGLYTMIGQTIDASYKSASYLFSDREKLGIRVKDTPLSSFFVPYEELNVAPTHITTSFYKVRDELNKSLYYNKEYYKKYIQKELSLKEYYDKVAELSLPPTMIKELSPYVRRAEKLTKVLEHFDSDKQKRTEKEIADSQIKAVEIHKKYKRKLRGLE